MSLAEGSEELETVSFYIHQALELAFNGNIGAPIHEKLQTGAKVLEFGCGTGIWTAEVAAEYPDSKFYAVDLTTRNSIDHNITFISCDIHHKLPFPDNEFDYVFSRNKTEFFSKNTFQGFLFEIFRVLKPEGWLEIVHSLYADDDYGGAFSKGANISFNRERGIDFDLITHLEDYLKMTGKTEFLSSQIAKIPLGGAGFGEFTSEIVLNYVKNMRNAGSPFEGYEQPLEDLESEMKEKRGEIYSKQKRVFARKKNMDTLKDA